MGDKFNTISGWVLAAGIVALGSTIAAGKYFNDEPPETPGYPIAGVSEAGEGAGGDDAGPPIEALLASADPAKGAEVFKKCTACHTIVKGGPAGTGPNLWGVIGKKHGHQDGFAYSDALKGVAGPWTFTALNEWLTSPRKYANGTKMTFAGLSKPEDRANVIAYLNQNADSPQPLPTAPAPGSETPAADAKGAAGAEVPKETGGAVKVDPTQNPSDPTTIDASKPKEKQ